MGSPSEDSPDTTPEGSLRTTPHRQASVMRPRWAGKSLAVILGKKANSPRLTIPYPLLADTNIRKKEQGKYFLGDTFL